MRLIVNFRKPFVPLEEALLGAGCSLLRNVSRADDASLGGSEACLVDFCDAARHLRELWRLTRAFRPLGVALVGIDRDAPWYKGVRRRRLWLMARLRLLDLYASHSLQGAHRFAERVLYLPNAARLSAYNLGQRSLESLRAASAYEYDVSFIVNLDAVRFPEHRARVALLHALRERLARESIRLALFDSSAMSTAEQVRLIQTSRINLSAGAAADDAGERSWGLPERCYGIPACGGFLLSDARRHAADDFVAGKEWVDYAGVEDCVAKIRHYLAHFDEARAIAEAAHARVTAQHTYAHRATHLIGAVRDLRARGTANGKERPR